MSGFALSASLKRPLLRFAGAVAVLLCAWATTPFATAQQANIALTKHNLSKSGPGTVKATTETQICVFCHTPHAANSAAPAPLWNRTLSSATYTPYTSNSLDAQTIFGALSQPGGSSKLCLSCHDGTMALGTVGVLGGKANQTIAMSGTGTGGVMPAGPQGATTGFTRNLGVDLRNDHPISFTFNDALATADGELRHMDSQQRYPSGTGTVIGIRKSGYKPLLPLQPTGTAGAGQVQCTTCHDPHLNASKFLRLNRLQAVTPAGGEFIPANDQICLGCHNKLGTAWSDSSHASETIADEPYTTNAATLREFPTGTKVWQAGCLNCHDTHAVQGTRRLLREGVGGTSGGTNDSSYKTGFASTSAPNSVSAIEETCYQCHTSSATKVISAAAGSTVPDIKTEFGLTRHMPITTAEQLSGVETHDIKNGDFVEDRTTLGSVNMNNRHVECPDCHVPHRVTRNNLFNRLGDSAKRTHVPGGADGTPSSTGNGNIASGALRGAFGVEPVYAGHGFFDLPNSYTEKKGDGGTGASTAVGSTWVTREYQICLKCHSDYAYPDDNVFPSSTKRPQLGGVNLTPSNPDGVRTNYTSYTNQAREFQPNNSVGATGAGSSYQGANHRSWHPVMAVTGRTTSQRNGMSSNAWLSPWNANVGAQTMYCTDCHGSNASGSTAPLITPDSGVWGPHGSQNNFLLKRPYDQNTGNGNTGLCFRCHDYSRYGAPSSDSTGQTGFRTSIDKDGHAIHYNRIGKMRCNWCHIAVPHGWKNKSFLVNLNDIGAEAGYALTDSKEVAINGSSDTYSNGPYYRNAKAKILTFRENSAWSDSDCGTSQKSGANLIANSQGGTTNKTSPSNGKDWMTSTCSSPP
ncbi:MAG TPA: cytochrome c3 family protein [Aromatoleum sp.]|uniref:cytochrome c3 family protein n=1 Tax=Aromatoleum sp. TaxID=2307007 RepID=UPI002B46E23F|nr:cytochrome c3 family protein [Aromatoleum sp.]HJV25435.1 cytochrome c3 family protein [Aromatoleum sp.]